MSVAAFVDTNVLVYADDRAHPEKRRRAQELIRDVARAGEGWLSLQVLQEYFAVATRKLGLDADTRAAPGEGVLTISYRYTRRR